MTSLRLGIIGMSDGNGHPYSWSAIFNGYNAAAMAECPLPVIPAYLARQTFPQDAIPHTHVTHIWTQDKTISRHIAKAALIDTVVDKYESMVGQVDAVLLARDDAENHLTMSAPFLKAGLPVYIDKPLAYSTAEAERIYDLQRYEGQIFTCSALGFAAELRVTQAQLSTLGALRRVEARISNSWEKYAVHVIEPALNAIGDQGDIVETERNDAGGVRQVKVTWASGLQTTFSTHGPAVMTPEIVLVGDAGRLSLQFKDTFAAFKSALQTFVDIIRGSADPIPRSSVMKVVRIIEIGCADE